jgi:leader peptidase (prepilin peptidase)/N-methyltransferase
MTTLSIQNDRIATSGGSLLAIPAALLLALAVLPALEAEQAAFVVSGIALVLLVLLGAIDLVSLKVPNLVVYPSIAFLLAGTGVADFSSLDDALLGAVALLGAMFVLALIGRGTMGMGDVKFGCLMGCALGWQAGLMALLVGFALGGLVAAVLMVCRIKSRKDVVPLTPFLVLGALVLAIQSGLLLS